MTSLPQLPPELKRSIRERAHRNTSLAEAEVLTVRAIATKTLRTPVDDVRESNVKGRWSTVDSAQTFCNLFEEPEVNYSYRSLYSGRYADDPDARQTSDGSMAEPSFHSRSGNGTGTITGYSYSPFQDAGPDEISWSSRYRSHWHPVRRPMRPLSTSTSHHYPICSSSLSYLSPSRTDFPPSPFSVEPCRLLPRSRDTRRSASSAGLSWKHILTSASEADRPPGSRSTSSSLSGALKGGGIRSGHPLRPQTFSAVHPHPSSTTANFQTTTNRGHAITRDPSLDRKAARDIAALDKLCMSITICSVVGEDRPTRSSRPGSTKKPKRGSSRLRRPREVNKSGKYVKTVLRSTSEGGDAAQNNGEVSVNDGTNGTVTDGAVPFAPGKDGSDTSVDRTVTVNDGTNGAVSVNGGTDSCTGGTILTTNGTVPVNGGTDSCTSGAILTTNGAVLVNDGADSFTSGRILTTTNGTVSVNGGTDATTSEKIHFD